MEVNLINLLELRKNNKLTQGEVAKYLSIATTTYCNKEKGVRAFSLVEAKKLSILFSKTIEGIFF